MKFTLVCFVLILGACSGNEPAPDFCQSANEVIFDPRGKWLLPFPSDYYLREDPTTPTGFRVHLTAENTPPEQAFNLFPTLPDQLSQLDGFGTSADIAFGFAREIGIRVTNNGAVTVMPPPSLQIGAQDTTRPGSPVVLIGLDEGSPDHGRAIPLLLEYVSDDSPERGELHFLLCEPAFPLLPKTTYALALTRNLKDSDGQCLSPSASTRALITGRDSGLFGRLGELAPAAVRLLTRQGFIRDAGELAAITVFTTQSIEEEVLAAVSEVLESARDTPPGIIADSLSFTPGAGDVALVAKGKFSLPIFQSASGEFVVVDGKPVVQGSEAVEFELIIPAESATRKGPFPVVIYQHGLTGFKEQDRGAKTAQARAGFASLAIDAILHGTRSRETGWNVTNFFAVEVDSGTFNMPVLRDNLRQTFLDVVSLAELVPALARLDLLPLEHPDGVPEISEAPVYLSGHSLGAIIAAGALPLSPRIPIGNVCAGGGRLVINTFMKSSVFSTFIDLLKPEDATRADIRRFMPLLQTLIERGDPLNLARLTTKHILLQEVIDDQFVPNPACDSLARALNLDHLTPVRRPVFGLESVEGPLSGNHPQGITAAFFQYDRLADGQPADHLEIYADPNAQRQWIHFFETFRDLGRPEVIAP